MRTHWLVIAILGMLFTVGAGTQTAPTRDVQQALAPTGKLRVGLSLGPPAQVVRDSTSGEMKGVGFDLGKELAQRMGVPFEPVIYPSGGALFGGLKSGEWDLAFLGHSPERENVVDFTAPFLNVEYGYLVPSGSAITALDEVDRPGIRVGAPETGSVVPVLTRTLKNAVLVKAPGIAGGVQMLKSGRLDVFAANKANLFEMSDQLPGSRVLEGRFGIEQIFIALPKGREQGMAYVRKFTEDAKSEGLVKAAVKRAGLRGVIEE